MGKNLVIYGIGRFAEYTAYLFENDSNYDVKGFCLEKAYLKDLDKSEIKIDTPIQVFEELEKTFRDNFSVFIAVGNNQVRSRLFSRAKELGYHLASYVSTKAIFWDDLSIKENTFIGEGSIIQPLVEIGENSFIIGGRIGHHSIIGKHILLSGSTIGGNTKVGNLSFLGLNSAVSQNVVIADENIIGMNTTIERDTSPYSVYTQKGTTLRKVDSRKIANRTLS